jgi:hypothetical protein
MSYSNGWYDLGQHLLVSKQRERTSADGGVGPEISPYLPRFHMAKASMAYSPGLAIDTGTQRLRGVVVTRRSLS